LASGVLIDIDHLFDYYLQGKPTFNILRIYKWFINKQFRIVIIVFHSLEMLLLLWLAISYFKMGIVWVAFAIGLTQHMLLDMLFNPARTYALFFLYRLVNGFKREAVERPVALKGLR